MKKTSRILATTLLLGLLAVPVQAQNPLEANSAPVRGIAGDIHISEKLPKLEVEATYPALFNPRASASLRDWVQKNLHEFKVMTAEDDLSEFPWGYDYWLNYKAWQPGSVLSVKLQRSEYTGGAHPNHWPITMLFHAETGQALSVDDVFVNPEQAAAPVAAMLTPKLKVRLQEMEMDGWIEEGVGRALDTFVATKDGLLFFFAPYAVAPYVAGEQEALLTYDELGKLVRPEFLLLLK